MGRFGRKLKKSMENELRTVVLTDDLQAISDAVETAARILMPKFDIFQQLNVPKILLANSSTENTYHASDNVFYLKTIHPLIIGEELVIGCIALSILR
ncbi:MAG: hypothetical protein HZB65_03865 [Candidatus Aenigmarchaeota archaeon]|nr:hypothetical protein [Candidatus Aenigmarchaeota archaeon]